MTPPPGSRVISCENAIRRRPSPMASACCDTHASTGCQRAGLSLSKRRSPHPASCAQVGRSLIPMGRGAGPGTSRSRIVPSRLHAVVLPVQRLQSEFSPGTRVRESSANPGAFARDLRGPVASERHARAPWPRGPTCSVPRSHSYGLGHVRRTAAGKAKWGKHFGVHRTVRSPFNRVEAPGLKNKKSRLHGLAESLWLCCAGRRFWRHARQTSNREPVGRDSRQAATTLMNQADSRKGQAFQRPSRRWFASGPGEGAVQPFGASTRPIP
jgi:hypothetical protein